MKSEENRIKISREMLERNRWSEDEALTTLGELDIGSEGVPVRFVACRPGKSEPLIFRGTALSHSMTGDGDVLVSVTSGGFADLPGITPCLKQPFEAWDDSKDDLDENY